MEGGYIWLVDLREGEERCTGEDIRRLMWLLDMHGRGEDV